MGKVRDGMPKAALEHLDRLAAEEHARFVGQDGRASQSAIEPDDTLTVYSIRLTNREKIQLRQLATKMGRPATEIARDFIRRGLEETLSTTGRIRPDSELGAKYLASISESINSLVEVFDLDELKDLGHGKVGRQGAAKPRRKKGA